MILPKRKGVFRVMVLVCNVFLNNLVDYIRRREAKFRRWSRESSRIGFGAECGSGVKTASGLNPMLSLFSRRVFVFWGRDRFDAERVCFLIRACCVSVLFQNL